MLIKHSTFIAKTWPFSLLFFFFLFFLTAAGAGKQQPLCAKFLKLQVKKFAKQNRGKNIYILYIIFSIVYICKYALALFLLWHNDRDSNKRRKASKQINLKSA